MSKLPKEPSEAMPAKTSSKKEPPSVHYDVPAKQLKGVDVGEKIKVTISGKVESLRIVEEKGDNNWPERSSVRIVDPDITISKSGDIGDLAEDD